MTAAPDTAQRIANLVAALDLARQSLVLANDRIRLTDPAAGAAGDGVISAIAAILRREASFEEIGS
jgi:hypothetical protein